MAAERFVEEHLEIPEVRRFVDVRPAGTKVAEWITTPQGLLISSLPAFILALAIPVLMPLMGLWLGSVALTYMMTKPKMPLRYSAGGVNPANGKKGDGILYFGGIRSALPRQRFKEVWAADDNLRKHMLIIGSTGSGKSETLKGIFFNALCWSSGFFIADGKADNQLPLDVGAMARSVGRDDSVLFLNFLLAGLTPQQVAKSRTRRTNGLNPFSSADADTLIQMGSNLLPKAEGDAKNWQEKALNLWRSLCVALCYKRDLHGFELSVGTFVEYMSLDKVGELYIEGYRESLELGEWSYGYAGMKTYLESGGCPGYSIDVLMNKHGLGEAAQASAMGGMGGMAPKKSPKTTQDNAVLEQHGYRSTQLMPALNLLDKTYGYIFRAKYPEIDMVDVTLNNRILVMLIPSLEKSAQEAENLGKLAIACLRVMMGKNLGAGIEGTRAALLDSKATKAPYPFVVALDELAYYFADGLAVIFAQARSLGMYMISATQDLKKLTEGSRAAEAGAMIANTVLKYFMRIDEAKETWDLIRETVGKARVAVRRGFERDEFGWRATQEVSIEEIDRVSLVELQKQGAGEGVLNTEGRTMRLRNFYMGDDLKKYPVNNFRVLRFLQVPPPSMDDVLAHSIPMNALDDKVIKGRDLLDRLRHQVDLVQPDLDRGIEAQTATGMIQAVARLAERLPQSISAADRGIALYREAREFLLRASSPDASASSSSGSGGQRDGLKQIEASARVAAAPAVEADPMGDLGDAWGGMNRPISPVGALPEDDDLMGGGAYAGIDMDSFDPPPMEVLQRKPMISLVDPVPEVEAVPDLPDLPMGPVSAFTSSFLTSGRRLVLHGSSSAKTQVDAGAVDSVEAFDWMAAGVSDALGVLANKVDARGMVVGLADSTLDELAVARELLSHAEDFGSSPRQVAVEIDRLVAAEINPENPVTPLSADFVDNFFSDVVQPPDSSL